MRRRNTTSPGVSSLSNRTYCNNHTARAAYSPPCAQPHCCSMYPQTKRKCYPYNAVRPPPHGDPALPNLLKLPLGGEVDGEGALPPPKEKALLDRYATRAGAELGLWLFLAGTVQVRSCQGLSCFGQLHQKMTRSKTKLGTFRHRNLATGKSLQPSHVVPRSSEHWGVHTLQKVWSRLVRQGPSTTGWCCRVFVFYV